MGRQDGQEVSYLAWPLVNPVQQNSQGINTSYILLMFDRLPNIVDKHGLFLSIM